MSPTDVPTVSPTQYQQSYIAYHPSNDPTSKPTYVPIEIYNNEDKRLEFYIYYNDTNGINMILEKWMKIEFLSTFESFVAASKEKTEWQDVGILNLTVCAVFNVYSHNQDNKYCQRFMEYGFYENDPNIDTNRLPSSLNV